MRRIVFRWRTMTAMERVDYVAAALTLLVVIAASLWMKGA